MSKSESRTNPERPEDELDAERTGSPTGGVTGEDRRPGLTRGQQRVARIIVLVLATVVAVLISELFLRMYWTPIEFSWFPRYSMREDPHTGARFRPNLRLKISWQTPDRRFRFSTNDWGFRSEDLPAEKAPGTFRVMFVGDSFTEGFGVNDDQTMPFYFRQIARRMNAEIEVVNTGQNTTDIPEYLGMVRGYADRLDPDLVVLSLYCGNDLSIEGPPGPMPRYRMSYGVRVSRAYDDRVRSVHTHKDPARSATWIMIANPKSPIAAGDRWLHEHSLFYRLTTEHLIFRIGLVRWLLRKTGFVEVEPNKEPVVLGMAKAQMFMTVPQPDVEERRAQSVEMLSEIKKICEDLNVPIFVQIIPYSLALPRHKAFYYYLASNKAGASEIERTGWIEKWETLLGHPPRPEEVDKDIVNERFRQMVEEVGFEYVDLTPLYFQSVRFDEFLQLSYRAPTGHWRPEDNVFDAGVLLYELIRHGRLPDSMTTEGLGAVMKSEYGVIQLPWFLPDAPNMPGGMPVLKGFGAGTVVSSFPEVKSDAAAHVAQGYFTPVFNVEAQPEEIKAGDFIEWRVAVDARQTSAPLLLLFEICRPEVDTKLHEAVRQSVRWGGAEVWAQPVPAEIYGRYYGQMVKCPPRDGATTLAIRVEATRDFLFPRVPDDDIPQPGFNFDHVKWGEMPLMLRMRRLRMYAMNTGQRTTSNGQ